MTIRILIAGDHEVVRQGLRTFIEPDPESEVVGEAGDGAEAVQQARRLRRALSNSPMKEFCSPSREALHQIFISLPGA